MGALVLQLCCSIAAGTADEPLVRPPAALQPSPARWHCLLVQSVGKTSIITRFMYDKFDTTYQVCGASISTSSELACVQRLERSLQAVAATCCRGLAGSSHGRLHCHSCHAACTCCSPHALLLPRPAPSAAFPHPTPWLQATIGIDFLSKTMYLEDRTVRLQLWCAGLWAGCLRALAAAGGLVGPAAVRLPSAAAA